MRAESVPLQHWVRCSGRLCNEARLQPSSGWDKEEALMTAGNKSLKQKESQAQRPWSRRNMLKISKEANRLEPRELSGRTMVDDLRMGAAAQAGPSGAPWVTALGNLWGILMNKGLTLLALHSKWISLAAEWKTDFRCGQRIKSGVQAKHRDGLY